MNIKKYALLILYVLCYFPLLIVRYWSEFEFMGIIPDNVKSGILPYISIIFIIIILIFTTKIDLLFEKHIGRVIFLIIVAVSLILPVKDYARKVFLYDNIDIYNKAVGYILENDNGNNMQLIKLPDKYNITTSPSSNYASIIRDDNKVEIFFRKDGIFSDKGYVYVINLEEAEKPAIKEHYFYFDLTSDYNGFWAWDEFQRGELPTWNDRNWE